MPGSGADGTLGDVDRNRSELADFLSTRRARLTPTDAGLAGEHTRRRVPGLRREELAQLAGVSVDYYTRLEQGRSRSASVDVLEALATALQLDDDGLRLVQVPGRDVPAPMPKRPPSPKGRDHPAQQAQARRT